MKQVFKDFVTASAVSPDSMRVMKAIVDNGSGLGIKYFTPYRRQLLLAIREGFAYLSHDKVYLTRKADMFMQGLLVLARDEGEI